MPPIVVRPAETLIDYPLNVVGHHTLIKLSAEMTGGRVSICELSVPPLTGPPQHRHSREDEWFYVLDGDMTFEVDGSRVTAQAGTALFVGRGTVHTFQNFGQAPIRMLVLVSPAGLESFFVELHHLLQETGPDDRVAFESLLHKYGMELMGPPLT